MAMVNSQYRFFPNSHALIFFCASWQANLISRKRVGDGYTTKLVAIFSNEDADGVNYREGRLKLTTLESSTSCNKKGHAQVFQEETTLHIQKFFFIKMMTGEDLLLSIKTL